MKPSQFLLFRLFLGLFLLSITDSGRAQVKSQPQLGYRSAKVLTNNGLQFKDLNKNGKLDPYEDWRLSNEVRIKDLISQMTLEEKIGFMIISTTRLKGDQAFQANAQGEKLRVISTRKI